MVEMVDMVADTQVLLADSLLSVLVALGVSIRAVLEAAVLVAQEIPTQEA